MNLLIRHIEYLMLRHDCVVIPGLGALIAHYRPAYIDKELGCMFPPSRLLGFNPEIIHNDGLLTSSIARGMETTFENASAILSKEVSALKLQLDNSGEYALGRLGLLSRRDNGPILFEPFTNTSVTPRYAGLQAVAMAPISEIVKTESEAETATSTKRKQLPLHKRAINVAASIALLLCIGVTLTTPIIENRTALAALGSSISVSQPETEATFKPVAQPDIDLRIALPSKEEPQVKEEPVELLPTAPATISLHLDPADRYYLIVASLPTREKAEEYVAAQSHGDKLAITEADGRYRVYVATGNTIDMARLPITIDKYALRYPNAWVCRR